MASQSDQRLESIVTRLALAIAVAVAAVLPLGYYFLTHRALADRLQAVAEVKAGAITGLIAANPELWRFQVQRLEELLARFPVPLAEDHANVYDAAERIIASAGNEPARPALARSQAVYESGREVGAVRVAHSLLEVIRGTAIAVALGLLLGNAVFYTLRVLPLRALRKATAALYQEKERAQVTLQSIGDAVVTTDAEGNVEYMNPVAEKLTGWTSAEARGRAITVVMNLMEENSGEPVENPVRRALGANRIVSLGGHVSLARRDGSALAIDDAAAPIRDAKGAVIGAVMIFRDVTEARNLAQRINWQATHDPLTGLVNRREFENRVEAALLSARNSNTHHVVCFMDLDQFKDVNDTCGHSAGDELLREIAALLQGKIRSADTLARIGGDEFGLLLDGCPLDRAQLIAADLLAAVRDYRLRWEGKVFGVGVSIGMAALSARNSSAVEVLAAADTACYAAKEQGRDRVCVYRESDAELVDRRRQTAWVARISQAMEEGRLALYYQRYLQFDPDAERRVHIEVLLRMIDEQGNLVLPRSFLPAAERHGLMPEIDRWVCAEVFANYWALAARFGGEPLTCGINVSGASLNAGGFLEFIGEQARAHALPPKAICFEVSEAAVINNLRQTAQFVQAVHGLGFLFALDDFGAGTSSFTYLKNLPADYLKIGGSVVRDLERDPVDRAMAEAINRIGHIMGLKTVGEFAETGAIVEHLRAMGVDFAQGYALSVPASLVAAKARANAAQQAAADQGISAPAVLPKAQSR